MGKAKDIIETARRQLIDFIKAEYKAIIELQAKAGYNDYKGKEISLYGIDLTDTDQENEDPIYIQVETSYDTMEYRQVETFSCDGNEDTPERVYISLESGEILDIEHLNTDDLEEVANAIECLFYYQVNQ